MKKYYSWKVIVSVTSLFLLGASPSTTYTNTIGMEFVIVPEGTFWMGKAFGTLSPRNEIPLHQVTLSKPFYMGKYEVTQKQWQTLMGNNPSAYKTGNNHPVEQVSWEDVQNFIRRLNSKEKTDIYRLPTEAEWEYACRSGGKNEIYSGGNNLEKVGWYDEKPKPGHHPVGEKAPNGLGLYDMSGNVYEWVQDIYNEQAYYNLPSKDPVYTSSGSHRVSRGGSWVGYAGYTRCANRYFWQPNTGISTMGVRIIAEIPTTGQ